MRASLVLLGLLLAILAVASASAGDTPGGPEVPPSQALDEAADWWLTDEDGDCVRGSPAQTDWAAIALAGAGEDPHEGSPSLVDQLERCGFSTDDATDDLARHVLAIAAVGEDPRDFDGEDWVEELRSRWAGTQFLTGTRTDLVNDDVFAILALRAAGVGPADEHVQAAADFVLDSQNDDGGFAYSTGRDASSTDLTGAALEALSAARVLEDDPDAREDAVDYLAQRAKQAAGCFEQAAGDGDPDVSSTGWTLLGLLATHHDPRSIRWADGASPWDCLRAAQTAEGGFRPAPEEGSAGWRSTRDAVLGLAGIPRGRLNATHERPTATLEADPSPQVGQTSQLEAHGAAFAGWQAPDGRILDGAPASWTPEEAGSTSFDVLVFDAGGTVDVDAATFDVDPAPDDEDAGAGGGGDGDDEGDEAASEAPTVRVDDRTAERGVVLELPVNATGEAAPVVELAVDWGDGNQSAWTPEPTFTHTYERLGEHTLTAKARDADGRTGTRQATVEVVDAAPRLSVTTPTVINRTETFTATAEAYDPDGPAPSVAWSTPAGTANGSTVDLALEAPGEHELVATARDGAGNEARASTNVTALNRPPANLTVSPARVPANASVTLTAAVEDPDGDEASFTWLPAGSLDGESWGAQRHVETGAPGTLTVVVNASDPHGAWTRARVDVTVAEDAGDEEAPAQPVRLASSPTEAPGSSENASASSASTGPPDELPRVRLPGSVEVPANATALLEGTVEERNASLGRVEASLGTPLPVRGKAPFTVRVPALPPGDYELVARAVTEGGHAGPPATVAVHAVDGDGVPSAGDPIEPDASASGASERAAPALGVGLALATVVLAAGGRRR